MTDSHGSEEFPRAAHAEMDSRASLAQEFFEVTHAELAPFVGDEATWFDFDYLEPKELIEIVQRHYGLTLDEDKLALPFWRFLDYLNGNRV